MSTVFQVLHVGLRGISPAAGTRTQPPTILLHAFPLDSRMWSPVADVLAARGVVAHAFDAPGFGTTPVWDVEPSIDAIADAAVMTLRHGIGATSATWIGCSMGGYVALAISERHPGAVAGLGLVGTRSTPDDDAKRAQRLDRAAQLDGMDSYPDPGADAQALVGMIGDGRAQVVARAEEIIRATRPAAAAWGLRAMAARPDRTEVLRSMHAPCVVVWGDRDGVMSAEDADHMAGASGATRVTVAGAGHLAPLEAPADVAGALSPLWAP